MREVLLSYLHEVWKKTNLNCISLCVLAGLDCYWISKKLDVIASERQPDPAVQYILHLTCNPGRCEEDECMCLSKTSMQCLLLPAVIVSNSLWSVYCYCNPNRQI